MLESRSGFVLDESLCERVWQIESQKGSDDGDSNSDDNIDEYSEHKGDSDDLSSEDGGSDAISLF